MHIQSPLKVFLIIVVTVSLVACSGSRIRYDRQGNVVPQVEKRSKYGNQKSYVVFGKRYYVRSTAAGYRQRGTGFLGAATDNPAKSGSKRITTINFFNEKPDIGNGITDRAKNPGILT